MHTLLQMSLYTHTSLNLFNTISASNILKRLNMYIGATFNRGFNRALGSLLAGILAIGVAQLALCSGRVAEPFIIGISIFLIGTLCVCIYMPGPKTFYIHEF